LQIEPTILNRAMGYKQVPAMHAKCLGSIEDD